MSIPETPTAEPQRAVDPVARFVESLVELADPQTPPKKPDRAALAALRRGRGQPVGAVVEILPIVYRRLHPSVRPVQEPDYFLVASLFGWHPSHWPGKNLGGSLFAFAQAQRETRIEPAGVERRLVALLDADRGDLPEHLRHVVGLLRSREIGLDYVQLLRDVLHWDHPERWVQQNWARAYWGGGRTAEGAGAASAGAALPDAPSSSVNTG